MHRGRSPEHFVFRCRQLVHACRMRRMPPDPEEGGAWGLLDSCQAAEEVVVVDMALDRTRSHGVV